MHENMVKDSCIALYSDIFNPATKIATIRNVSDVVWLSSLLDDVIVL